MRAILINVGAILQWAIWLAFVIWIHFEVQCLCERLNFNQISFATTFCTIICPSIVHDYTITPYSSLTQYQAHIILKVCSRPSWKIINFVFQMTRISFQKLLFFWNLGENQLILNRQRGLTNFRNTMAIRYCIHGAKRDWRYGMEVRVFEI